VLGEAGYYLDVGGDEIVNLMQKIVGYNSGNHAWLFREDAAKCCNGFRRVLVINDPKACDIVVSDLLPGGISYGYRWMPV